MQEEAIARTRARVRPAADNPAARRRRVREFVRAKATACAALGLAGAPEAELRAVQAALVEGVARLLGVDPPPERVIALVDLLGVSPGLSELGRALLSWVPGGPPLGTGAIFAGTVALGETAAAWVAAHLRLDEDALRELYRAALPRARAEWPVHRSRALRLRERLVTLRARLAAGSLAGEDYDEALERLGEADDRRAQLPSD